MKLDPVTSSAIEAIGYDWHLHILEVRFEGGALYNYLAVPEALYRQFMEAESKGRFFSDHIRDKFAFHRR